MADDRVLIVLIFSKEVDDCPVLDQEWPCLAETEMHLLACT
jgi:hypothetical protein